MLPAGACTAGKLGGADGPGGGGAGTGTLHAGPQITCRPFTTVMLAQQGGRQHTRLWVLSMDFAGLLASSQLIRAVDRGKEDVVSDDYRGLFTASGATKLCTG